MPIVQQGSINTTALIVPDLYVQIVPPQNLVINGVRVTNANCRDYFELLHGVTPGKELVFE